MMGKTFITAIIPFILFIPAGKAGNFTSSGCVDALISGLSTRLGDIRILNQRPDLPVIITKAESENKDRPFVLLISGDGGWYGFEQSMANHLAHLGIPTVGINARRYFWNRRTPEETTSDVVNLITYYRKEFGKERYLLIGYSQGAEIVPFIVNRLPGNIFAGLVSAVLLSPDKDTDFEVHFTNMIGIGNRHNTYQVTKEIADIHRVLTLCIFGEKERSPVPGILAGSDAAIAILPGRHHYKGDIARIIETIKEHKAL
jgi:type IV secretory pathway VirJ component